MTKYSTCHDLEFGKIAFFGDDSEYPMRCPECGETEYLSWDVAATIRSGDPVPDIYWTAWTAWDARCDCCNYEGTINEFVEAYEKAAKETAKTTEVADILLGKNTNPPHEA